MEKGFVLGHMESAIMKQGVTNVYMLVLNCLFQFE